MDVKNMTDIELAAWDAKLSTQIKASKTALRALRRDRGSAQYEKMVEALSNYRGSLAAVEFEIKARKAEAREERKEERAQKSEARRSAWRAFWDEIVA